MAVFVLGIDGNPHGGIHRRVADSLHRLYTGARRTNHTHHKFDPCGRGIFFVCNLAHFIFDASFNKRSPPRAGMAARRREPERMDGYSCDHTLSHYWSWHFACERTRIESSAIRR